MPIQIVLKRLDDKPINRRQLTQLQYKRENRSIIKPLLPWVFAGFPYVKKTTTKIRIVKCYLDPRCF